MSYRVEPLLSARLFMFPQHVAGRIYFLSNLSGHLSLFAMKRGGSVPEPLLPPNLALQNPDLVGGYSYCVYPRLDKILIALDHDGDENYQPMLIGTEGGYPEPAFDNYFAQKYRVHLGPCDLKRNIVYIGAERRDVPVIETYRGDLKSGKLTKLAESEWGYFAAGYNRKHTQALLLESYTSGDNVLYLHTGRGLQVLYGKPLKDRQEGEDVPLTGITSAEFAPSGKGVVVKCAVFDDAFGPGYLRLSNPGELGQVRIKGLLHKGAGELEYLRHIADDRYTLTYNIDGVTWAYEAEFDERSQVMKCKHVLVGRKPLDNGKLEHMAYDEDADLFALTFSTATSPTQIYTVEGGSRRKVVLHTAEKILGLPAEHLSSGEDASFISHDGLRVSARLYLPARSLGFSGPRPLVYYIHGGPQGQERPDFAWFSMPLIQYLTLRGFAVFVPNVRGSTGYGLAYTKQVDRDWGGKDRLDHVHAMKEVLPADKRLD
ncbi:MAG TPA: prolyl oligopeptidase family serine peptidase, partial [Ramlibacter sp.]|nr:prolyl oligopeptidase family serine peptidase [Ramlibacter sp.]